jgi:hypothetical protein
MSFFHRLINSSVSSFSPVNPSFDIAERSGAELEVASDSEIGWDSVSGVFELDMGNVNVPVIFDVNLSVHMMTN